MFDWSDKKDAALLIERGIGFQDVVFHIEQGDVLAVTKHPNKEKYPNQHIFFIRIDDYVYMVPFLKSDTCWFLKTIIPSRKATKKFLEKKP